MNKIILLAFLLINACSGCRNKTSTKTVAPIPEKLKLDLPFMLQLSKMDKLHYEQSIISLGYEPNYFSIYNLNTSGYYKRKYNDEEFFYRLSDSLNIIGYYTNSGKILGLYQGIDQLQPIKKLSENSYLYGNQTISIGETNMKYHYGSTILCKYITITRPANLN